MKTKLQFLMLVVALMALPKAAQAEDLRKDYSKAEIIEMIRAEGYSAVKEVSGDDGSSYIEIKVNGITYTLRSFDDGDLLLYFGMTGFNLTYEDINEWNRQQRLSRAYLDHENDPILEADLLANGGYNAKHLTEFLGVFVEMSLRYRDYLRDADTPLIEQDAEPESI